MSVKEEIIEKIINFEDLEEKNTINLATEESKQDQKKFLDRIKRKYRIMLIFLVCLSLILLIMIFPVIIVVFIQNS